MGICMIYTFALIKGYIGMYLQIVRRQNDDIEKKVKINTVEEYN